MLKTIPRALALLLGLCLLLEAVDPRFDMISPVWADDDDDGDDDDDDGGSDDDDDGPGRNDDDDDDGWVPPRSLQPRQPAPQSAAPVLPAAPPPAYRPELVTLGLSEGDLATLLAQGFTLIEEREIGLLATSMQRITAPAGMTLEEARGIARALPSGGAADFNHFYRGEAGEPDGPTACEGAHCPAFRQIGWPSPADYAASCGPDIVIGLIDTGLNPDHEAFAESRLEVLSVTDLEEIPGESDSGLMHGTSVASLLIGAPDSRTPGLVPDLHLVAADAFHRAGNDERADVFALITALDLVVGAGAQVINLSLSGPDNDPLRQAIERLGLERGVIFVAAVGNGGPRTAPAFPAAYDRVIGVTAVDGNGTVYRRAGQGDHVDIAAPGVEVWTAASIRGGRPKTGTSFAAPFVTAAIARLLQAEPGLDADALRDRLATHAFDIGAPDFDPVYGHGLLQVKDQAGCAVLPPA